MQSQQHQLQSQQQRQHQNIPNQMQYQQQQQQLNQRQQQYRDDTIKPNPGLLHHHLHHRKQQSSYSNKQHQPQQQGAMKRGRSSPIQEESQHDQQQHLASNQRTNMQQHLQGGNDDQYQHGQRTSHPTDRRGDYRSWLETMNVLNSSFTDFSYSSQSLKHVVVTEAAPTATSASTTEIIKSDIIDQPNELNEVNHDTLCHQLGEDELDYDTISGNGDLRIASMTSGSDDGIYGSESYRPMTVQQNRVLLLESSYHNLNELNAMEHEMQDKLSHDRNQTVIRHHYQPPPPNQQQQVRPFNQQPKQIETIPTTNDKKLDSIFDTSCEKTKSHLYLSPTYHKDQFYFYDNEGIKQKFPTFMCPNCGTEQRMFFTADDAADYVNQNNAGGAGGYLAFYFFIYVILSLFIFGMEEGWKPIDCIYFAVITLTTAGLGDYVPTSDVNKIICSIFIYFGVACIGLLLGSYIASMLDERANAKRTERQIESCPVCTKMKMIKEKHQQQQKPPKPQRGQQNVPRSYLDVYDGYGSNDNREKPNCNLDGNFSRSCHADYNQGNNKTNQDFDMFRSERLPHHTVGDLHHRTTSTSSLPLSSPKQEGRTSNHNKHHRTSSEFHLPSTTESSSRSAAMIRSEQLSRSDIDHVIGSSQSSSFQTSSLRSSMVYSSSGSTNRDLHVPLITDRHRRNSYHQRRTPASSRGTQQQEHQQIQIETDDKKPNSNTATLDRIDPTRSRAISIKQSQSQPDLTNLLLLESPEQSESERKKALDQIQLGSPLTRDILRRQSHTRHFSFDAGAQNTKNIKSNNLVITPSKKADTYSSKKTESNSTNLTTSSSIRSATNHPSSTNLSSLRSSTSSKSRRRRTLSVTSNSTAGTAQIKKRTARYLERRSSSGYESTNTLQNVTEDEGMGISSSSSLVSDDERTCEESFDSSRTVYSSSSSSSSSTSSCSTTSTQWLTDETKIKLHAAKYVFVTLRIALVNSLVIIAVGCIGFWLIEGFSLVDSWYFTTVLLTTVGYGDIVPKTHGGKLFATIYILVAGTILLNNMSSISMIPLELRRLRIERAVLTQFGEHLDDAALHELATGPVIQRLHLSANRVDGLDECTREMFALAMLVRLGKVTEYDIKQTFASFRRLDVNNDGVLNSRSIIAGMIKKTQQQQRLILALKGQTDDKVCKQKTTINNIATTKYPSSTTAKAAGAIAPVVKDYGSTEIISFATSMPSTTENPPTSSQPIPITSSSGLVRFSTMSHNSDGQHLRTKQSSANAERSSSFTHITDTNVPISSLTRTNSASGRYWFGRQGSLYVDGDDDDGVVYRYPSNTTLMPHIDDENDDDDDDDGSSMNANENTRLLNHHVAS